MNESTPRMSSSARGNKSSAIEKTHEQESRFVIAKCRRNNNTNVNQASANQETSEDSDAEEKILVVYCRSGKLGAAYYTLQTGELFTLEEIIDRPPEHQIFSNLFRQVEPAMILLDGHTQNNFVQTVKKIVFDNGTNDEGRCKLIFISAREFIPDILSFTQGFEACKRRIYSLTLPNEPQNCTEEERTIFLRTAIDFSQTQTIHALGALLRYLDLNWANISMDLQSKPQFLSLKKVSLADIVTIDEDSYRGLQIFTSVAHPSNFKKGVQGSSKEGLSLFHMFSKCFSMVGQSRMRVLLRHPTTDILTLKRRQDVIAYFMRPQSDVIMRNICASMRFIKNVNGILAKIKALSAKSYQWKSLYNVSLFFITGGCPTAGQGHSNVSSQRKTLYNAVLICEMCENTGRESEFLEQLASCDNNKLYEMALYMNRIIDFDLSKSEGKFTVKAGVDSELDMKKQTMASLHGLMSETAKVELEKLPDFIEECTMLYMPHLGYLLGVKAWAEDLTMQQKELPDMRFMFQNNDYIHYKSKGCEELDMMIGDTYPEIVAHETRIMMRLTAIILENLHTLASVIDKCAELDCLIAISKVCKEHNYVRPVLTIDKIISIKQGRHPLHAMSCDHFVPNDAESSQGAGLVKIITGPNSSGKSVYMKQTVLIIYLAHIGSFVPAEFATIGLVTHIYTRIQSTECVAAHMSAFLIDLRQMSLALSGGSRGVLCIDEFGKGTSQTDGLALLAACLNTLLASECPHVLLATHYLNIKDYIVDTPMVRFLRFDHMIQNGEPVFLYCLTEGTVDSSFAHQVAASSGIEQHVVNRAGVVLECLMNNILPPANKKIIAKLKTCTEIMKTDLLAEDI